MGAFRDQLRQHAVDPAGRRWVLVAYDQLTDAVGPLARLAPGEAGVVVVETPWKADRRPYHKQKLALLLASQRHFALEQARRGVAVRHVAADGPYREALAPVVAELGALEVMEPAERELRADLAPLVARGAVKVVPHEGWLTEEADFVEGCGAAPPWRMDAFYRHVRRRTGVLMEGDAPVGGRYSFDGENRRPWPGEPEAPPEPTFPRDAVKDEVADLVEARFGAHPGRLDRDALPATREDAEALWRRAREACLPRFGPFEDAMSTRSRGLFHTRVSALMNLHRLLPRRVLDDVVAMDLPLASKEGFVRQVLGWREMVRHVHRATDGLRRLPGGDPPVAARPGDGGWAAWAGRPWRGPAAEGDPDGGACPSHLGAEGEVPPAFWGEPSGLACLDRVVADVWETGYGHHITRLMVLANLATLLDVAPRALADWFWVAYTDAFDWVVEPNVLAMGTFGVGPLMTTKPYVSGTPYLHRMGDYCEGCAFDPRRTCPISRLYWAFLARHRERLDGNPRLRMPLASLRRRDAAEREMDAWTFRAARDALAQGRPLEPGRLAGGPRQEHAP